MNRIRFPWLPSGAALGLALVLSSCGGSTPAAPEGSTIYLTAEYTAADTTTGNFTAIIHALVLNQDSGDPQRGVGILFLVTAGPGQLNSKGEVIETDNDGVASDILSAYGATATNAVTVTASSGGASQTITLDITGSSTNLKSKPVAKVTATPSTATINQDVTFDVGQSTDSDGTIKTWNINYGDNRTDSSIDFSTTKTKTHKYTTTGTYSATVTLTDNDGLQGNASVTVTVQ